MFSPRKRAAKLQISLNGQVWSKSFGLQSADGTLSLLESQDDLKKKQREQNMKYYLKLIQAGGKLMAKFTKLRNVIVKRHKGKDLNRKKREFSIRTHNGVGIYSRSKIITFTPRFAFKNETDHFLLIKQEVVEDCDENRVKLKPNSWAHFHWNDYHHTTGVHMSITDANFAKPYGWSGMFKIDEVTIIISAAYMNEHEFS